MGGTIRFLKGYPSALYWCSHAAIAFGSTLLTISSENFVADNHSNVLVVNYTTTASCREYSSSTTPAFLLHHGFPQNAAPYLQ